MPDRLRAAYGEAAELANARALPGVAFTDPAVFDDEVDRVLKAGWLPVARESEVASPGDYRAADLLGEPLVVTRDNAGAVHVLSRVCRHRGMSVVEGAGNAKALTCPYHLWRYHLDGRFAAAPGMERSAAFDRNACDLPRIAAECWGGWVFANLDGKAAPLGPQLAPLAERVAHAAPEALVTAGVVEFDSPWNWKVMVENFLESYHHIGPHSATLQQTNPGLGTYEGQGGDLYTVLENPASEGHAPFVVAAVFPLTLMFFTEAPSPPLGVWYELADLRGDRFRLRVHLLTPPDFAAVPEYVEGFRAQVTAIHLEDIPACEGVQKGVASALYRPGPLSHLEACLFRFHQHLRRAAAA
jgi:phenylpropionate dioxygenase-like ring-hydroxylating dioxygenase large terminal subunit